MHYEEAFYRAIERYMAEFPCAMGPEGTRGMAIRFARRNDPRPVTIDIEVCTNDVESWVSVSKEIGGKRELFRFESTPRFTWVFLLRFARLGLWQWSHFYWLPFDLDGASIYAVVHASDPTIDSHNHLFVGEPNYSCNRPLKRFWREVTRVASWPRWRWKLELLLSRLPSTLAYEHQ